VIFNNNPSKFIYEILRDYRCHNSFFLLFGGSSLNKQALIFRYKKFLIFHYFDKWYMISSGRTKFEPFIRNRFGPDQRVMTFLLNLS